MTREKIRFEGSRQHLAAVVGEELSAITFVRDYIQFHFDGPRIDAFTLPRIAVGGTVLSKTDPGYRDALCERIGVTITDAYVDPKQRLQIDFADGSVISISLKAEDRIGEESAVYDDALTKEWASW